jgi:RNA polymerase sigma factor (sigma-70 family)
VFSRDPLRNPEPLIRRVYAYVAYRLGDGPDAEDATSETFERALRYRNSYDPSKGQPIAWLIGIARRCVDEGLARRQLTVPDPLDVAAPDDMEETIVRRVELAGAVARLEERERELIALRYGADLTARQIAGLWGMQTNAVEVALHRALLRLRGILGEESESGRQPGERAL